ncbi:hypothetical protein FIBSPDRAFT_905736 [Athelia psychrophila]|uniref:Uncharacterized protein n=1 Tax=Athelia psychrophila TaxID=1759441 RepID=A0A167T4N3_9AGAM|nr:hypothetical protein FIBSPDRAFT_905736 [Fibularhizoctonia sp. CBS 109695]
MPPTERSSVRSEGSGRERKVRRRKNENEGTRSERTGTFRKRSEHEARRRAGSLKHEAGQEVEERREARRYCACVADGDACWKHEAWMRGYDRWSVMMRRRECGDTKGQMRRRIRMRSADVTADGWMKYEYECEARMRRRMERWWMRMWMRMRMRMMMLYFVGILRREGVPLGLCQSGTGTSKLDL